MTTSKRLTIFEGPDGAGKTTAAIDFAESTGAKYVHFSALSLVTTGVARMYVEAMLPALLGYQDVVFDRSWLSEVPYGTAFRDGSDRLGNATRRMLERLAFRCNTVLVNCRPPLEVVLANYRKRKQLEMLENEDQLSEVYGLYKAQSSALPAILYDYTVEPLRREFMERSRSEAHSLYSASAGNLKGKFLLVGDKFAEPKNQDAFYQWPFASFDGGGCSQWLANHLDAGGIDESQICWVNADQDLTPVYREFSPRGFVVALGAESEKALAEQKIPIFAQVPHPQFAKRFASQKEYPLAMILK